MKQGFSQERTEPRLSAFARTFLSRWLAVQRARLALPLLQGLALLHGRLQDRRVWRDRRFTMLQLQTSKGLLAAALRLPTGPSADHYLDTASWGSWVIYDKRAVDTCVAWIVEWLRPTPLHPGDNQPV